MAKTELDLAKQTAVNHPHLLDDRERQLLIDHGYGNLIGADRTAEPDPEEIRLPVLQHYALPVWLVHVGLQSPDLLGRYYPTFQALVMLDHQTDCLSARRHGHGGAWFAVRMVDVAALAGIARPTAYRHAEKLSEIAAVDYQRGKATGAWPEFRIDRGRVCDLYKYAAPSLPPILGGTRGVRLGPGDTRAIYGLHELRRVTSSGDIVLETLASNADNRPATIDPAHVRELLGIPEGFAR